MLRGMRFILAIIVLLVVGRVQAAAPWGGRCDWSAVVVVEGRVFSTTDLKLRRDWYDLKLGTGRLILLEACGVVVGSVWRGEGRATLRDPGLPRATSLRALTQELPGEVEIDEVISVGPQGLHTDLALSEGAPGWTQGEVPFPIRATWDVRRLGFDPTRPNHWEPSGSALWSPDPSQVGLFEELHVRSLKHQNRNGAVVTRSRWFTWLHQPEGALGGPDRWSLSQREVAGEEAETWMEAPDAPSSSSPRAPFAEDPWSWAWDLEEVQLRVGLRGAGTLDHELLRLDLDAALTLVAHPGSRYLGLALAPGRARYHGEAWAPFNVQEVRRGGSELPWAQVGDRLWIDLGAAPAPGTHVELQVSVRGELLEDQGPKGQIPLAGWAWYPRAPVPDAHRFVAGIQVPVHWQVAATGAVIEELISEGQRTVTTRENRPVPEGAILVLDAFDEGPRKVPRIRCWRSQMTRGGSGAVGEEVHTWIERAEALLGPAPFSELDLVELDTLPGVVMPGILPVTSWDAPPDSVVTTASTGGTLLNALVGQWLGVATRPNSPHDAALLSGLRDLAVSRLLELHGDAPRALGLRRSVRDQWLRDLDLHHLDWFERPTPLWSGAAVGRGAPAGLRGSMFVSMLADWLGPEATGAALRAVAGLEGPVTVPSMLKPLQGLGAGDLRPLVAGWYYQSPLAPELTVRWRYEVRPGGSVLVAFVVAHAGGAPSDEARAAFTELSWKEGATRKVVRLRLPAEGIRIELPVAEAVTEVRADPRGVFPGKATAKEDASLP